MRSPLQTLRIQWLTELLIMGTLCFLALIVVLLMLAWLLENIIVCSDIRRANRERQHQL